MPLDADALDDIWASLATALDAVPAERRELFLAKLALTLAHALGDPDAVRDAIALAGTSLDPLR